MKCKAPILLLLVALLLLSCFAGCKTDSQSPETQTSPPGDQATDTASGGEDPSGPQYAYDEDGFILDNLPELSFEQQNVNLLHWQGYKPEYSLEDGDDIISSAVYSRILSLEERLKCFLTIKYMPGDWNSRSEFNNTVYNDVQTGEPEYDIVSQYSFCAPVLTMYGCYRNLNEIDYIDLDMPWWNSEIRESVQVGDKLYFATGDIAPSVIYNTYCILFNYDTIQSHGYSVDALYQTALDREWTLEALETMITNTYRDLNQDGLGNNGDFFGISVFDLVHFDSLFYAAGLKIFEKNESTGNYVLSSDYTGSKTITLAEDCIRIFHSENSIIGDSNQNFVDGNSLFALTTFGQVTGRMTEAKFKYGILPVPMFDSAQGEYSSSLAVPYSMYSVTYGCSDYARAGAVLEALASHAYRKVTPAIYEEGLKTRYAKDDISGQIYDIIRETVVFDIGRLWGEEVKADGVDNAFALFRNTVNQKKSWSTQINAAKGVYVERLENIIDAMNALDH